MLDRLYSVPVKPLSTEIWHLVCDFFSLVCTEGVEEELGPNLPAVWLDRCGIAHCIGEEASWEPGELADVPGFLWVFRNWVKLHHIQ